MEKEFEFMSKSLDAFAIEDKICNHYGLGYANSSSFGSIKPGVASQEIRIYGTEKRISCHVSASFIESEGMYLVTVSSPTVTNNSKRKK